MAAERQALHDLTPRDYLTSGCRRRSPAGSYMTVPPAAPDPERSPHKQSGTSNRLADAIRRRLTREGILDLLAFFLSQHAALHASDVSGRAFTVQRVFSELSDDQMRIRPGKGLNSLVWLLWHMARTEDAAVNLVVAGRDQVICQRFRLVWSSETEPVARPADQADGRLRLRSLPARFGV